MIRAGRYPGLLRLASRKRRPASVRANRTVTRSLLFTSLSSSSSSSSSTCAGSSSGSSLASSSGSSDSTSVPSPSAACCCGSSAPFNGCARASRSLRHATGQCSTMYWKFSSHWPLSAHRSQLMCVSMQPSALQLRGHALNMKPSLVIHSPLLAQARHASSVSSHVYTPPSTFCSSCMRWTSFHEGAGQTTSRATLRCTLAFGFSTLNSPSLHSPRTIFAWKHGPLLSVGSNT
mmetsp:Transcript_60389/g.134582  ORF Transcript_60389/g.134582 Transcript_60389/m.134582 type:complete len:233 (-) Transcript_60389:174-872(-)